MSPLSDRPRSRPPAVWRGLLRFLAREEDRVYLLDDLEERFRTLAEREGLVAARRWYSRQAFLSLFPLFQRRIVSVATSLPGVIRALGALTMTDLLFSLRLLRKNFGTTTAAVMSLVIGITLNATIFSVVDWLWLRSSPFSGPHEVVRIFAGDREGRLEDFSYLDFEAIRDATSTMTGVTAAEFHGALLTGRDETTRMTLVEVTARDYFDVLGLQPAAGIVYHAGDDPETVAEPGVVISYSLWQRAFGGDPAVVGRPIQLTGKTVTVLGVAPRGYGGIRRQASADIWYPVETWWGPSAPPPREGGFFLLLGRIAPGTEVEQVQAEVGTIMTRFDIGDEATREPLGAVVMTDAAYQTRNYGGAGALLMTLVAAVLLIACANVAGLQLARTLARQKEMAIRMALGSRRGRLIRQLLTEGLVVSLTALVLSLGLSRIVLAALPSLLPRQPVFMEWGFGLDGRVMAFATLLALLSALVFSLPPALRASRPGMVGVLKGNDLATAGSGRPVRTLNVLVVAQLALSLILVSTTALLLRSFLNTQRADLGIERNDVLVSWIAPGMDEDRLSSFYSDLVAQTEAIPGIRRATMARTVPFFPSGTGASQAVFATDASGSTLPRGAGVKFNLVGPGYFQMLGISVLRGRPVTEQDGPDDQRVAVVNETLAARVWPGEDPVGRTLRLGDPEADPVLVVGVAEDGKYNDMDEQQEPYIYLPFSQMKWGEVILLAETDGDPTRVAPEVRQIIRSLDPDSFVLPQTTLNGLLRDATYDRQLMALALGILAALGLFLAVVGLYGVSSHAVNRQRREIGIRIALGANEARILRSILDQGGRLILLGTGFGIAGALVVGMALRGNLFGVSPMDPLSLVGATVILGLATLVAVLLPSRRAASVEPMKVIRRE